MVRTVETLRVSQSNVNIMLNWKSSTYTSCFNTSFTFVHGKEREIESVIVRTAPQDLSTLTFQSIVHVNVYVK